MPNKKKNNQVNSEKRYQEFIKINPVAIWCFETDGEIRVDIPIDAQIESFYKYGFLSECSDSFAQMYGYSTADEVVGARLGDLIPQSDPANIEYLESIVKSGFNFRDGESHEIDKEGNNKYFLNSLVGVIENNVLKRVWGMQVDITKQKQAEKEAQQLYNRTAITLDSIRDAFFSLDKNWHFTYINKHAQKFLLDKNKDELIGKNFWDEMPNARSTITYKKFQQAMKTNTVVVYDEYFPSVNKWIELHVYPSREGISIYFSDITEQKELEQRKDEFISFASHELKTPITSIKGYLQLIQKNHLKEIELDVKKHIQKMDSQVSKLIKLINDLLDISKIQSGKISYNAAKVDLNQCIKESIDEVQQLDSKHKIIVQGNIKRKVTGDYDRIVQVITNLLSNAIKYSPGAPEITVSVAIQENDALVKVQDFGIGINKNNQKEIFDRFYRVSGNDEKTYPGLGIGLYISSEIIKHHKGKIWVDSEKGKGSTFCFMLPLAQEPIASTS
jgi:PAS domain S-box-containing protein